jgi:hypothetical protein
MRAGRACRSDDAADKRKSCSALSPSHQFLLSLFSVGDYWSVEEIRGRGMCVRGNARRVAPSGSQKHTHARTHAFLIVCIVCASLVCIISITKI